MSASSDHAPHDGPAASSCAAWIVSAAAFSALVFAASAAVPAMPTAARLTLAVLAGAVFLWLLSPLPAFATGTLALGSLLAVSVAGGPGYPVPWVSLLAPVSSAPITVTLGGMILAVAAQKHGISDLLASRVLAPFAKSPRSLIAATLAVTALLSMWMSNTATAAMMLGVASAVPGSPAGRRALFLAVAAGANVGGIVTPVGTAPNTLAYESLARAGTPVDFARWALVTLPVAAVTLVAAGAMLSRRLATSDLQYPRVTIPTRPSSARSLTIAIVLGCVAVWATGRWTGIPLGVSALLPLVALPALGLLGAQDLKRVEWSALILMASGLALGVAMERSGLASIIVSASGVRSLGTAGAICAFALLSPALSTVMSNTAVANLLIPVALGLTPAGNASACTLAVALSSSMAMCLPVSTPPNALAHATGAVATRDLLGIGAVVGAVGTASVVLALLLAPAP